jgi:hypothetical protein
MAPPTILTLRELAGFATIESIARVDVPRYVTRPAKAADGRAVLLWHGDSGYESGDANLPGPRHRLYYDVANLGVPYEIEIDVD